MPEKLKGVLARPTFATAGLECRGMMEQIKDANSGIQPVTQALSCIHLCLPKYW
jgi:hypothetical protein